MNAGLTATIRIRMVGLAQLESSAHLRTGRLHGTG